jgi:hypothetical protein
MNFIKLYVAAAIRSCLWLLSAIERALCINAIQNFSAIILQKQSNDFRRFVSANQAQRYKIK